jgi:integrase
MVYSDIVTVRDATRSGIPTALLIIDSEPFDKLLEFFRERCLSISTERTYAQAVGRFVEWLSVRALEFAETASRGLLYTSFAHDVRFGTYRNEQDVCELGWLPTSQQNLRRLTKALIEFSDWLNLRYGATAINPINYDASYSDRLIFWRRWNKVKVNALLAHTKSRIVAQSNAIKARRTNIPKYRSRVLEETKAFPLDRLDDLLWKGFINPGKSGDPRPWIKYNLRDILITIMCLYGGCRASEPLHLWVDDVFADPDDPEKALVLVHEPIDGKVNYTDSLTGVRKKTSRIDFLQRFCGGRKPLTHETGRRHSGWKGCLLTHHDRNAFQVFWIDKTAGRIFLQLWRMYVQYVRPLTPQLPWAFLTKDAQPLGVEGYEDSLKAAVRRIGLVSAKWAGTSSHGLRHRYGQWLNELGIDLKEGQVAMHHLNPRSQEIYRVLGVAHVADAVGRHTVAKLPQFQEI